MTEPHDIDMLAGEYVLGTLDPAERIAVAARRLREPDLSAAIEMWERRLGGLAALGRPVSPPPHLYAKIEARIEPLVEASAAKERVAALQQMARRWRYTSVFISGIAASLLILLGVREIYRPQAGGNSNYVAVFQQGDVRPAFMMSIDLERRLVLVRPVSTTVPAGKTFQLWIVTPETGGVPRSLGLLSREAPTTRAALPDFDPAHLRSATFGISLEPEGGSPTGRPTGPALHSKLFPSQL